MAIKALVFDFDGLIVDTETPEFELWQYIYHKYGKNLTIQTWGTGVGSSLDAFDAVLYLASIVDFPLDQHAVRQEHRALFLDRMRNPIPRPGFLNLLQQSAAFHLKVGVASSSPRKWVEGFLKSLCLQDRFDCICCMEDVDQVKPAPDLYFLAIQKLGVDSNEAMAFEDSPNGIMAAKKAGLWCTVIPNPVTQLLDISSADYEFTSMEDVSLDVLLDQNS